MSKKKGRGRDLNKVIGVLDGEIERKDPGLISILREFHNLPIKRGLQSENIYTPEMAKKVNEALEKASSFYRSLEDLRNFIDTEKPEKVEGRFACRRVIAKFLESR